MDIQRVLTELDGLKSAVRLTLSDAEKGADVPVRVQLRRTELKGEKIFQLEKQIGTQAFHENLTAPQALTRLEELLGSYRQVCIIRPGETVTFTCYGKKTKRSASGNSITAAETAHDRARSYLLPEGEAVPALVDLGIFTPEYKIVHSKSDKYKQINRFLELIDDKLKSFDRETIRVMDFGCGKSYLTFILYYYLTVKRGVKAEIIGYDLKRDVVEHCNGIAEKYGCEGLHFYCGDVSRDTEDLPDVDMLVTLHACDTATDYALDYAIRNRIPYIFSVPCCQHEVNLSLHKGGEFDLLQKHGLIKERFSALLTDAVRAEILEKSGYDTDVLEFVDLSHTPKNVMLRCRLRRPGLRPDLSALEDLQRRYGFRQTLLALTEERLKDSPALPYPAAAQGENE